MTAQTGAINWWAVYAPFGAVHATGGALQQDMRFPGQWGSSSNRGWPTIGIATTTPRSEDMCSRIRLGMPEDGVYMGMLDRIRWCFLIHLGWINNGALA
ncbi:hypothetical protein ACNHKD_03820 [Methylocystis sp. JAN1]|uniref:hypothetical protein n=1 Tax=Methylocystis sp. JAN1 TaxID=3397211 RepID=UPI003FA340DB